MLKEGDEGLEEQFGGYKGWSAWCHHQEIEKSVGSEKRYRLKTIILLICLQFLRLEVVLYFPYIVTFVTYIPRSCFVKLLVISDFHRDRRGENALSCNCFHSKMFLHLMQDR